MGERLDPGSTVRDLVERQAAWRGSAPFLISAGTGRTVTYAGLRDRCRWLAAGLAGLGLEPGDRVATLLENGLFTVEVFLGALYGGFVPVTLSALAGAAHARDALEHSAPRLLLVSPEHAAMVAAGGVPAHGARLRCDDPDEGPTWPAAALGGAVPPAVAAGADGVLGYTSGTTGRPKGVLCSHRSLLAGGQNTAGAHRLGPDDRALAVTPLALRGPQNATLMATFVSGGSLVVPRRFDVTAFWDLVVRYRCTWFPLAPTLVAQLLSRPPGPAASAARAHVRFARSSAAALTAAAHREFEARFGLPLLECMGVTEAGSTVFSTPLPPAPRKIGSPGVPTGLEVRIVDEAGRVLPPGEAGEILVRGPSVMTGYYRDPVATAEVLSPDGWLRVGDVGYLDADGYVFLVGRAQEFVKKGGVKVALREVDEALGRHPAVLEAAAVGVADAYLGEELVAFVVLRPGLDAGPGELLDHCERELGTLKMPARVERIDELPRGPSGKVERRRLADRAARAPADPADGAARPALAVVEAHVAEAWRSVMGLERVEPDDDFFALGGHSLAALRIVARLRRALAMELPVQLVFEAPTMAALAARILAAGAGPDEAPPVAARRTGPAPLSLVQARLWRHARDVPATAYTGIRVFELTGRLDVSALGRALAEIVRRHEILRTTYVAQDGEPAQVVHPPPSVPLPVVDVSDRPERDRAADQAARDEAARPIDLARLPLLRAVVVRLSPERHRLLLTMHHITFDRRSMEVFFGELRVLYDAFARGAATSPLPEPALQYADYAVWQRRRLGAAGDRVAREIAYWTDRLASLPDVLRLPCARATPGDATPGDGVQAVGYSEALAARVEALGRVARVTPFMVWLAGFTLHLHHASGARDLLLGTYASVRGRPELDDVMGYFINFLLLRIDVEATRPFREHLAATRAAALAAFAHGEVTFEMVADALRAAGRPAPVPEVLVLQSRDRAASSLDLPGLRATRRPAVLDAYPWGLSVIVEDGPLLQAAFDPRRYDPTAVRRMLSRVVALVARATADPAIPGTELARPEGLARAWARGAIRRLQPSRRG
jgi:acyl-CoA synthetase (AMP-forming)/AMP-acid ligase II